ncbi:MAG: nucleotide exchange factor GrpE [Tissierella sp.]|uniref:nucleotide exchange factor GrpE n=1 Tax=Tissierella sp. TaxID=41274 RepID=UPI003F97BF73
MKNNNDEKEDLKDENVEDLEWEERRETDNDDNQKKSIFSKLKSEAKKDSEELDKALKENEELNTQLKRLQADFSNYKKRVEKEKENLVNYGIESLALEILPIIDNFERALDSEKNKEDSFYEGIKMIYDGFIETLNKNDIREIDCLQKPFDPECHHAVGMENTEEFDKDTVIKILQKGYLMKDKVIRPSMVIVSQ